MKQAAPPKGSRSYVSVDFHGDSMRTVAHRPKFQIGRYWHRHRSKGLASSGWRDLLSARAIFHQFTHRSECEVERNLETIDGRRCPRGAGLQ
jgi:hypothetical protein